VDFDPEQSAGDRECGKDEGGGQSHQNHFVEYVFHRKSPF